jgi:uncharacterized protein
MGPVNVSLVKLLQAEMALRQAMNRLDAASATVRAQERRIRDLTEKLNLAQSQLRELQAKAGQFELEVKTFDAHIEKLRTQQQQARNNKEYQVFLTEINTGKVDRSKVEDELLKVMEQVEAAQPQIKELAGQLEEEQKRNVLTREQLSGKLAELQREIDRLRPLREEAAAGVPGKAREAFERLAERYDGEAMGPIAKPDRRREEYICTTCNMALVPDTYNRLHSRDEPVFCPSCHRMLYIPDDLPPELAVNKAKPRPPDKSDKKVEAPVSESEA